MPATEPFLVKTCHCFFFFFFTSTEDGCLDASDLPKKVSNCLYRKMKGVDQVVRYYTADMCLVFIRFVSLLYELRHKKTSFPMRLDNNRPMQPQKKSRSMKLRI